MTARVTWRPASRATTTRRNAVVPLARDGHLDVTLAWLRKHVDGAFYQARWWVGPSDSQGEWFSRTFDSLSAARQHARVVAAGTPWGVEVTLQAKVWTFDNRHDYCGVWEFGRYEQREVEIGVRR